MPMTEAPPPPWLAYPGSEPTWSGWRQGVSEAWLLERWLPFWGRLSEGERQAYLERFIPPDPQWHAWVARLT